MQVVVRIEALFSGAANKLKELIDLIAVCPCRCKLTMQVQFGDNVGRRQRYILDNWRDRITVPGPRRLEPRMICGPKTMAVESAVAEKVILLT